MLRSSNEEVMSALKDTKGAVSTTKAINPDISLEELNIPEATLHGRVVCTYTRDEDMGLLFAEGKFASVVSSHWELFVANTDEHVASESLSVHGVTQRYVELARADVPQALADVFAHFGPGDSGSDGKFTFRISELKIAGEPQYRGIITADGPMNEFDVWFEALILGEAQLAKAGLPVVGNPAAVEDVTSKITELFDMELRNVTHDDMWDAAGKSYFADRIRFFVARGATIEACLPAFPCKSSNTMKVAGSRPDKGEELALRRLLAFSKMIKEVYEPGIKIWIVSDGHVFSDCIGVDDGVVDEYGAHLKELYRQISKEDTIGFRSLPELFTSRLGAFKPEYTQGVVLPHYLGSEIKPDAEVCREILMCGCSTDPEVLRSMIDANDPIKIALYRGFSKFMFEDLAEQPQAKRMSAKARRKLAAKVAFEMIKRNEAYSNLVGLLLPYHLRLSIHAHNNSGPKFGIRLLSHDKVRTVKSLSLEEMQASDDLLHIPTPWHNCVVDLEGKTCYYVVKSKVVKDAIESEEYTGKWIAGSYGEGGRFFLQQTTTLKKKKGSDEATSDSSLDSAMTVGTISTSSTSASTASSTPPLTGAAAALTKEALQQATSQMTAMALNAGAGNLLTQGSSYQAGSPAVGFRKKKVPTRYGVLFDAPLRLADTMNILEALSLVHQRYQNLDIMLITVNKEAMASAHASITTTFGTLPLYSVDDAPKIDVLVVPGSVNNDGRISCRMCKFIADQYAQVMHIFGPGSGSFILSKAGVLDGREASIGDSRKMIAVRSYENVAWVAKPWVYSEKVWTSSNMSSTMEALFAFISQAYGAEVGSHVATSMGY